MLREPYSVGLFETVCWRCYTHVANRRASERVMDRIGELLPHAIEMESCERYWKSPELAELRLVSPLHCSAPEDALPTTPVGMEGRDAVEPQRSRARRTS